MSTKFARFCWLKPGVRIVMAYSVTTQIIQMMRLIEMHVPKLSSIFVIYFPLNAFVLAKATIKRTETSIKTHKKVW